MNTINTLYEQNYCLWLQETYQLLDQAHFEQLDLEHLKEEIISLGNEQRRKMDS
ncbi:DUF29 family protein [Synechocystis sp. PCC 7338]|nr:DUF29 family protein [Synechocystis sp. PCC 7338]